MRCCGCWVGLAPRRFTPRSSRRSAHVSSEEEFKQRIDFLSEVPLFKRLPKAQYPLLASVLRARKWKPGATVVEMGTPLEEFSLIAQGRAEVQIEGPDGELHTDTLRPGDYFGEKLLEQGSSKQSPARIVAVIGLVTLSLRADEFEEFGLLKHLRFPRRQPLRGIMRRQEGSRRVVEKTDEEKRFIAEAVRANSNIRSFVDLREETIQQICDAAERSEVPKGTVVVHQGEFGGMYYIVHSGKFELRLKKTHDDTKDAHELRLKKTHDDTKDAHEGIRKLQNRAHESEMGHRMHRKELFFQTMVHGADINTEDDSLQSCVSSIDVFGAHKALSQPMRLGSPEYRRSSTGQALRQRSIGAVTAYISKASKLLQGPQLEGQDSPIAESTTCSSNAGDDADAPVRRRHSFSQFSKCSEVPRPDLTPRSSNLDNGVLGVRIKGQSFGEMAMLYNTPRTSTAIAVEDSVVWRVSQDAFRRIMHRKQQRKIDQVVDVLNKVDLLQGLLSQDKEELAKTFFLESFKKDDFIVRQGERQNVWYIIMAGECSMIRRAENADGEEVEEFLTTLHSPQYFGERSLLKEHPSEFSVQVSSTEGVRCMVLDGPTFSELFMLMKNEPEFRHAVEDDLLNFARYKEGKSTKLVGLLTRLQEARICSPKRGRSVASGMHEEDARASSVSMLALDRIGVLGTGAYGIVTLERDPTTGQTFALKSLSKGLIVQNQLEENIKNEREILTMIDTPFSIRLFETWKDDDYVYFLFEPLLGGDLHTHMNRHRRDFSKQSVYAFVVACISCALGHLHERNIVFRDLKPENILLDKSGYVKLCDFGFAKFVLGRAMTLCGTPEYVAPEVIGHGGYDRMVDWWALGILTFEIICGQTPFQDEDPDAPAVVIFCNIKRGIEQVRFPFRAPEAVSFIKGLLTPSPSHRLGIGGHAQVWRQPLLAGIDFQALLRMDAKIKPPYIPEVMADDDLSLAADDCPPPPFVPYVDPGTDWDADF